MNTDKDMLDWLEAQNAKANYTGKCLFRWSTTGRGWRLLETSGGPRSEPTFATVREAIDYSMTQEKIENDRLNKDYVRFKLSKRCN